MDNKLSVKFEHGLFEQTYKFRETAHLSTLEDIKKLVEKSFIDGVLETFKTMNYTKNKAFSRVIMENDEDDFEEII